MKKIEVIIEIPSNTDKSSLSASTLSLVAKSKGDHLRQVTSGLVCKVHPDTPSKIIVRQGHDTVDVNFDHFCCARFKKSVISSVNKRKKK